jgi:hypothetical protein
MNLARNKAEVCRLPASSLTAFSSELILQLHHTSRQSPQMLGFFFDELSQIVASHALHPEFILFVSNMVAGDLEVSEASLHSHRDPSP